MSTTLSRFTSRAFALLLVAMTAVACSKQLEPSTQSDPAGTPVPPANLYTGASVVGSWAPFASSLVAGVGASNGKGTVTVAPSQYPLDFE
jgi:hypothetical protein